MHGGKEEEKREKKEESRATKQRLDTRNPCTQYNPLSSDNTAGHQMLTNYPTQRKNERSH